MNRTKYFLASLLIVLSGLFATFSTANAQCSNCPYDANWYPNIPWNTRHDTIIYTVNNVTCTTIVNYCYRTVGLVAPFTEIFLCGAVYIPSGCAGFNNWDYREIDKFITEEIIKQNKGGVFPPCPVCPWVEPNYRTYYIGCSKSDIRCPTINAFCVISYTLCCKDGEPVLTEKGRSFQGTCPDGCLPDSCYWP